mgnify:CR=1 FL=1
MYEVRVEAKFEAGHSRGPAGEKQPLHHHVWNVVASARSHNLDHIGLVIDFRVLQGAVNEVLKVKFQDGVARVPCVTNPFDSTKYSTGFSAAYAEFRIQA